MLHVEMVYRLHMRLAFQTVALLALLSAGSSSLAVPLAELKDNYQPIVDRNPFGLKPPPPPPTNNPSAQVKEKPKTEIFLTGITSIGFPRVPKQVYLMTKEQNKKEPGYYTLTEGVEKDGIKVLNIDDVGRKVRIHTDEGEVLLSFQTHGVTPPAAPAAAKPGAPGQPIQPGMIPVPQPGGGSQPHVNNMLTYPGVQPVNNGNTAIPTPPSAIRQIPSRRVRAGMDANFNTTQPGGPLPGGNMGQQQEQQVIDPAESYIRAHLNNTAAQQQGIPVPPLPVLGGQQ